MDDVQLAFWMEKATPFLDWVAAHGDMEMCAAVSTSLERATLAFTSSVFDTVLDGKDAVMYLRSLACQAQFLEIATLFDHVDSLLLERLICETSN